MIVKEKREYNRLYYLRHKKRFREEARERRRAWLSTIEGREQNRIRCKEYADKNRSDKRVRDREYYQIHKDMWPARNRRWQQENREWWRARGHRRRTRGGLPTVAIVKQLVSENIQEYGELTCVYCLCAVENYEIEHKTPISRGGTSEKNNLCISCKSCNSKKGTKTVKEFAA